MPGQAGSRARVEWKDAKPQAHESRPRHLVSSGVTCCGGPGSFSELPCAGQPECVTGTAMLTVHGKDLGLRLALLSPVQY